MFCLYTPMDKQSQQLAHRCIESGANFGHEILPFEGVSKKYARFMAADYGMSFGFDYLEYQAMRPLRDSQIACFLGHRKLWELSVMIDEPIIIFEHDAFFIRPLFVPHFKAVLNLQRQQWDDPTWLYYEKLRCLEDNHKLNGSAKYICLPASAAYAIQPHAASRLLCILELLPLDLFINKKIIQIDDHPSLGAIQVTNDYSSNI